MRRTFSTHSLFRLTLQFAGPLMLILVLGTGKAAGQNNYLFDSLKKDLSLANTDEGKVKILCELADQYEGVDNEISRQYAQQAIQIAEYGRDRKLILLAYLRNGHRCLRLPPVAENLEQALQSYKNAEKVARESGLDEWLAYSYSGLSAVYLAKNEYDKALNYNNLALSIANGKDNDSLKIDVDISTGNTYLTRGEKLLSFRSYLEALDVAELSKKDALLRLVYEKLENFYTQIGEYDKAIDYGMKALTIDKKINDRYKQLSDYTGIGQQFSLKKEIDLALPMFDRAIALADTLRYDAYKRNIYLAITNMYFNAKGVVEGMAYLRKHPEIIDILKRTGRESFLNVEYGYIYTQMHQLDSAYYFLKKAEPEIRQKATPDEQAQLAVSFGAFYKEKKDYQQAIAYYLQARQIAGEIKDLSIQKFCAKNLDTLYGLVGNYKTAYVYNTEYNLFRDSLKSLSSETDLLKLEVDNDTRRRERLAKEEEENTMRRHNIQYMGLTVGLGCLFILLVMAGLFVVHPGTIRALGFFSFIFLFEFIILIADKQIQQWTHEEPWKVLLIKICLAAILLPLHHWLEHKVIHYLTVRKKFAAPGKSIWAKVLGRKQDASPEAG